jgi:hypothetical protein
VYEEDRAECNGLDEQVIRDRFCTLNMSFFWYGKFRKN